MRSGRRQQAGRRTRDLLLVAAIGAAAAALTSLLIGSGAEPIPRPSQAGLDGAPAPAGPIGATRPVTVERPTTARPRSVELKLTPPYEVADGLTIVAETRRVRLAGLEGPASEAACFDPDNRLWACGLQARAALYNLIRTETVTCQAAPSAAAEVVEATCSVGTNRLDRTLVQAGFARPLAGETTLASEMSAAKAAGRGLWKGGWRLRQ